MAAAAFGVAVPDIGVINPDGVDMPELKKPPGVVVPDGAAVVAAVCAMAFSSSAFLPFLPLGLMYERTPILMECKM